tara:strand:- start:50 stop:259 length:210 start_codon:yes stop_codon:yes gene_type:complete
MAISFDFIQYKRSLFIINSNSELGVNVTSVPGVILRASNELFVYLTIPTLGCSLSVLKISLFKTGLTKQ